MTRGLGKIERAILEITMDGEEFNARDIAAFIYHYPDCDIREDIVYPELGRFSEGVILAQVTAVLRAFHSLKRKFPRRIALRGGEGRALLLISQPRRAGWRMRRR